MSWTASEIATHWFADETVELPLDAVDAFSAAEHVHGREWVLNSTSLPGGGRFLGFSPFMRVYVLGKRVRAIRGACGFEKLLARLQQDERAVQSELAAIDLLRSGIRDSSPEIEFEPEVAVGDRMRHPDFRIRRMGDTWTYVEVTQLNRSNASNAASALLHRLAEELMRFRQSFVLEVILDREPSADEENRIVQEANNLCQDDGGQLRRLDGVGWLVLKDGCDYSAVVPTVIDGDSQPRMALAHSIGGEREPNRQVIVRLPFSDQRAEDVLAKEAKQLPSNESGLVMVDVAGQPSAFDAWPPLVMERFARKLHTRVSGVAMFMHATVPVAAGLAMAPFVKHLVNPHARTPIATWIVDLFEKIRAETLQRTGRAD